MSNLSEKDIGTISEAIRICRETGLREEAKGKHRSAKEYFKEADRLKKQLQEASQFAEYHWEQD